MKIMKKEDWELDGFNDEASWEHYKHIEEMDDELLTIFNILGDNLDITNIKQLINSFSFLLSLNEKDKNLFLGILVEKLKNEF